ncbi:hypothetical protein GMLC_20830 [Geomonas limicola]|uniref:Uncharacterized protein n=1 Tax=Geomonas limicola TaxID=2740186 RepID=A0A6V8N9D8_9BACT|nr:UDP-2,4-diacetamido-2,4,6-trideoxy-beta-L-altropyranose hydrolase [Geomonas limicola]GFO68504.1 hypothetical protein GMLC_20830 [Geomonas limicola]
MRLVIRADASQELGSGHVMRTLALVEALAPRGGEFSLVSRDLPEHLAELAAARGVRVLPLAGPAPGDPAEDAAQTARLIGGRPDWLVVDHYRLDAAWERLVRPGVRRLMVIDDLADRPHDCDLLLDQNLVEGMELRYRGLVPEETRLLIGPAHALLRGEFVAQRAALPPRDGTVERILVCFGGSDPTGETAKALEALALPEFAGLEIDVVAGGSNPHWADLEAQCQKLPRASFQRQSFEMARLMAQADLALGAGGGSAWERCFLGLPTLTVTVAANQEAPALAADRAGLARLLGSSYEVTSAVLARALRAALAAPAELEAMANRCLAFFPPRHGALSDELYNALTRGTP